MTLVLSSQQKIEQRQKLGEVYTWNCAGELYAIECILCEERPLCTLTEFAEHVEVWHSNWEHTTTSNDDVVEQHVDVEYDQSKLELAGGGDDNQMEIDDFGDDDEDSMFSEDPLEPFEQVLIATESDASESEASESEISESIENDFEMDEPVNFTESIKNPTELSVKNQIQYGMNEPLSADKLTSQHFEKLIELYRSHPRLWNQTHPEFSETHLCRKSWHDITEKWSQHCRKVFSTTDVRIRVSTLCQRYLKERERLENEGEVDDNLKFVHYEKLQFLDEKQTLQNRRQVFEKQNTKLLEIYQHFPILWHSSKKYIKRPAERVEAVRNISTALKLCGIHLSAAAVQRRLGALRKCYRIEKIRHLHCKVERLTFDTNFKLYTPMQFLDKHIDPYVCSYCGKIFENLLGYREHVNNENHGNCSSAEEDEDEKERKGERKSKTSAVVMEEKSNCGISPMAEENSPPVIIEDNIIEEIMKTIDEENSNSLDCYQKHNPNTMQVFNKENECNLLNSEQMSPDVNKEKEIEAIVESLINDSINITPISLPPPPSSPEANESSNELVVKVQCASFTYDLKLDPEENKPTAFEKLEPLKTSQKNDDQSFARLTVEQTRKLIALYQLYPQLWDPAHLDFNSRTLRRIAWRTLTGRLNKLYKTRYSWKTLHRKLTDYVKYYKREKQRIEKESSCTKWCFYDDFSFMDDVIVIATELQKSLQTKDINLKIIEIYKSHPQLWDTKHPDYTKRKTRQLHIDSICALLQEDCNIQITSDKVKQRLIEFRCNYRIAKQRRIAALKRNETFTVHYEFYEALQFIDPHVSPFVCVCGIDFKRLTDFTKHERKQHRNKKAKKTFPPVTTAREFDKDPALENVCHICGIKFTLRSNLVVHLNRHLGNRTHACSMCPKMFFNSTAVQVHERSHTKAYPCVCEQCGRSFVNNSKLNQHMKRHTAKRDFKCEKCEKCFYTAFERDRHMRWHLKVRDKVCAVCGKSFVIGSSYYAHMMLHNEIKRYSCANCGMRFAQYAGLYKHRKRHHPD